MPPPLPRLRAGFAALTLALYPPTVAAQDSSAEALAALDRKIMSRWGKVVFDKCAAAEVVQAGGGGAAWRELNPPQNGAPVCGVGTTNAGLKPAELESMFKDACMTLLKAQKNHKLALGMPDSKGPNKASLTANNWWKEVDPLQQPWQAAELQKVLGKAVRKCRSGIQFECNWCEEAATSFKLAGTAGWVQAWNVDLQLCPGLCMGRTLDSIRVDLAHELMHYGGAADDDSRAYVDPNDVAAYMGYLAGEFDRYAQAHPDDKVVQFIPP